MFPARVAISPARFRCLALALATAACAGGPPPVQVVMRPSVDSNASRSVYVLARAVDDKAFRSESYADVAAKVVDPDASVLASAVVLPGVAQTLTIPAPKKGRLAIYALYEQPEGDAWRVLLPEALPKQVELQLARGRVCWPDDPTQQPGAVRCAP